MTIILVATNPTSPKVSVAAARGEQQRIDYLALAERIAADYVDYGVAPQVPRMVLRLEAKLRLDFSQAWAVAHLVRKKRYELVFSFSERVGIPLAYLLPRHVKHVVQVHHVFSAAKLRLLNAARLPERWYTTLVYSHSEEKAAPAMLRVSSTRVHRLRDKVDTVFWNPGEGAIGHVGPGYFWSCGLSFRDYPTLTRAMRMVPEAMGRLHLGSNWAASGTLLDNETLPPNAHISSDFLSAHEMRERYRECRFVVLPIRTSTLWNAGSNAVLEAQAMGKPVIATRTPNMSDYVRDGETGILVPPGDAAAMASAIRSLRNNPEKAAAMGRRAREWIESAYSFDAWLDEAADLLEGLVRERSQA